MKKVFYFLLVVAIGFSISGCAPKAYVVTKNDSLLDMNNQQDIRELNVSLETRMFRNGERMEGSDKVLFPYVQNSLAQTKFINDVNESSRTLIVSVDNIASMGGAVAKGLVTGLTLFIVGSSITDEFNITVELYEDNQSIHTTSYSNKIDSTIGLIVSAPTDEVEPIQINSAYQRILGDAISKFIQEYLKSVKKENHVETN
ncbi:MAG: hypothetical protein WBG65_00440 [Sulfurimonadaceae bacterium]